MHVNIIEKFEKFAADFGACVQDDDWSRLEKHLANDATYVNVGGPDPQCEGCRAILAFFKRDVETSDRRFDKRTLVALTPPVSDGNRLSRYWQCTYSLGETPDLVMEGEARYLFEGGLIKEIVEELTPSSRQNVDKWMRTYADKLPT